MCHTFELGLERLVRQLKGWALIDLIQIGSTLFVVVTAVTYLRSRDDLQEAQRVARQSAAWQVINAAQGKGGSGGRIDALKILAMDGVDLDGVVLTNAYLLGLQLPREGKTKTGGRHTTSLKNAKLDSADLLAARLTGVDLTRASIAGADLYAAILDSADLNGANLAGADLRGARLATANLRGANLAGAHLSRAILDSADLAGANLTGADLSGAKLITTYLGKATLDSADLTAATLKYIFGWEQIKSMRMANIRGVSDAPVGFRCWALDTMQAVEVTSDSLWRAIRAGQAPEPPRPYCRPTPSQPQPCPYCRLTPPSPAPSRTLQGQVP